MSITSTGLGHDEALVCSPRKAKILLDVGTTRLYELIAAGELKSFKDGPKSRKILVSSIHEYIHKRMGLGAGDAA